MRGSEGAGEVDGGIRLREIVYSITEVVASAAFIITTNATFTTNFVVVTVSTQRTHSLAYVRACKQKRCVWTLRRYSVWLFRVQCLLLSAEFSVSEFLITFFF